MHGLLTMAKRLDYKSIKGYILEKIKSVGICRTGDGITEIRDHVDRSDRTIIPTRHIRAVRLDGEMRPRPRRFR